MKNEKCKIVVGDYQRGQVLIISLLVLVVALTVGLSVAVRSITTTRMTAAEDSSQRAFSAAEAGIERALTATAGQTITGSFVSNNSSYSTSASELSGDEILVANGAFINKDDAVDVWLSDYPDYTNPWSPGGPSNLAIYWGDLTDICNQSELSNSMAAIEVILLSGTAATPTIDHFAFDPCPARASVNNFCPNNTGCPVMGGSATVAGKNFANSVTIPITSGLLARIVPLYARTYVGVSGTGLPPQGTVITSTGNSGGTQRKIVSFRGYSKPPIELYPFLIFSPK